MDAVLLATAALLAGCGGGSGPTGTLLTGTPTAARTPAPTPTGVPAGPEPVPASRPKPKPKPGPDSRGVYLKRLADLASRLDAAIDTAARSGDSTQIARIDDAVQRLARRWLADGHTASPAATSLAAAIATARTNVESALLAPESHRQVRAARDALAAERAAG